MSRRAKSGAPPIILIFFQDIITSLSGIMIFLTLMMAVDVASHHELGLSGPVPAAANNEGALQALRKRVASLREAIRHLSLAGLTNGDPRRALANATQAIHEEKRQVDLLLEQEELRREIERLERELAAARQESKLSQAEQQELELKIKTLNEALAKALQGLLDHSMEQDHRLEQVQHEIEALRARTEDDRVVADRFNPGRLRQAGDK